MDEIDEFNTRIKDTLIQEGNAMESLNPDGPFEKPKVVHLQKHKDDKVMEEDFPGMRDMLGMLQREMIPQINEHLINDVAKGLFIQNYKNGMNQDDFCRIWRLAREFVNCKDKA